MFIAPEIKGFHFKILPLGIVFKKDPLFSERPFKVRETYLLFSPK